MKNCPINTYLIIGCLLIAFSSLHAEKMIYIYSAIDTQTSQFVIGELKNALLRRGFFSQQTERGNADIMLVTLVSEAARRISKESAGKYDFHLKTEGFSIRRDSKNAIRVVGADAAGVMYGGLELAEQIRLYGIQGVRNTDQNPYMEKRGIKFNIPLDVRTPSYSDMSDAAQENIAEMWSFDFWKSTIDNLARHRYNLISLWSLHPFPSMIKVPDYPDIALNDVQRSTARFAEYYSTRASGLDSSNILHNAQTVLEISIEEKIRFWQNVMKYAKVRNIDFYLMTWNIYTYGIGGKYGITDDMNNTTTRDYFRKSVKQMFLTYPDLAGIGVTTGENMGKGSEGFETKEDWVYDTYGQGVLDVVKETPDRRIVFIHRQHEAGTQYINQKFSLLAANKNVTFLYSFKYAQAHVLSCARQPFHEKFVREISGMKTLWTLRNDDNYYFRWGSPDFVREFIGNIPTEVSAGLYYGSDGYVWGKDFLSKGPDAVRQIEIEKHWYHWMLWGRLSYDPGVPNERFRDIVEDHFPGVDASRLSRAWHLASMIYPITTGFHWGALDYKWYIEGCKSRPEPAQTVSGFHDVNRFITLAPHPSTGYQSIPDYVRMKAANASSVLISPLAVSQQLHLHADSALMLLKSIESGRSKELANTVSDIISMAYLGKYYAFKIGGATHTALFRATGDNSEQQEAVGELSFALEFWKQYVGSAMQQYRNPLWTNRVGYVDWVKLTKEVEKDIEISRQ